jgi:hypothetical protein
MLPGSALQPDELPFQTGDSRLDRIFFEINMPPMSATRFRLT